MSSRRQQEQRSRPRAGAPALALAAAVLSLLAACVNRDADRNLPTADEQVLLDRLCRDPFIQVVDETRGDDGYLVVETRQGDTLVRYLIAPDGPASRELRIRRMVETFSIEAGIQERPGTGADPRGLER